MCEREITVEEIAASQRGGTLVGYRIFRHPFFNSLEMHRLAAEVLEEAIKHYRGGPLLCARCKKTKAFKSAENGEGR